jgi:hypothetical protein
VGNAETNELGDKIEEKGVFDAGLGGERWIVVFGVWCLGFCTREVTVNMWRPSDLIPALPACCRKGIGMVRW